MYRNILSWRTARVAIASDTLITDFKSANFSGAKGISAIGSGIMLRAFGKDTAGDTATLRVIGFMEQHDKRGRGPGFILWRGQLTLGSQTTGAAPLLNEQNDWDSAGNWFTVDDWDPSVASGENAASAVMAQGTNEAVLLLPTLRFTSLMLEIDDIGGGGTEMTELGIMYREITDEGVI